MDQEIHINKDDYFSLTDIAKYKNPEDPRFVIQNWMRRIDTIQYIGLWEQLNNPNFNRVEFDTFRSEAGHNYFTMTPKKWIDGVNAIGIISKAWKYNGGTYAHKDIALQFASWISPEINLYIIKEFQRLKADEQKQIGWTVKRELAKINYCIHTDAIKDNIIIPLEITKEQASFVYASEADVLNVALFGVPQTLLKRKSIVAFSPCFLTWLQRQRKKLPYASSLENLMPLWEPAPSCLFPSRISRTLHSGHLGSLLFLFERPAFSCLQPFPFAPFRLGGKRGDGGGQLGIGHRFDRRSFQKHMKRPFLEIQK